MNPEELRRILSYDPSTGVFRWLVKIPPRAIPGQIAGYDNGSGYIKISIRGKRYYAHRLAFIWMAGDNPIEVDHINHCRSDNRWMNLRASNRSENGANVAGRKGIRRRYGRWQARYSNIHLGTFDSEEEAASARRAALCRAAGVDPNTSLDAQPQKISKRQHRRDLFDGRTLSEWSRITGIPQPTLHWRISRGQDIATATADRRTSKSVAVDRGRSASRRYARTERRPSGSIRCP